MSNPKDWFRRRRRDPLPLLARDREDLFENDFVLDIARAASPPGAAEPPHPTVVQLAAAPRSSVPPPPPRNGSYRPPHILKPQAFATRPEIVRAASEAAVPPQPGPAEPAAEEPVDAVAAQAVATQGIAAAPPIVAMAKPPSLAAGDPTDREPPAPPAAAPRPDGNRPTPRRAVPLARAVALGTRPRLPPARVATPEAAAVLDQAPSFTLAAPGIPWLQAKPAGGNAALRDAFTPTRPKQQGGQFSGRFAQMQRIISAIEEERAHVVLYGERGSGKTSLANIIAAKAEEAGYFVLKFACSSELSFDHIFRSFLQRIPAAFLADGIGATRRPGLENFAALLPPGEIGIAELVGLFGRIHGKHVILVIDEYDRVTNEETRNKLAELIKNMSDASVPVTLLLIGVAEDVDALLGKHPSLQRTLVTLPLPLMTAPEIDAIILAGERKSGIGFAPEVRRAVVLLAQGLPYHAQLLCLFAARNALRRKAHEVEREDLAYAVERAAEEAEGKIKEAYTLAIASQSGTAFKDVLFAAACCSSDAFGTFSVNDVAKAAAEHGIGLSALSLQFPLKKLTEPARGAMLRRITGLEGLRYQFVNQMLRHHVLARQAVERGLV